MVFGSLLWGRGRGKGGPKLAGIYTGEWKVRAYLDLFNDVQCVLVFLIIGAEELLNVWSWHCWYCGTGEMATSLEKKYLCSKA